MKNPAMLVTVMQGLLVGQPTSGRVQSGGLNARPSWNRPGSNSAIGITRGLIGAHSGAQLLSTRLMAVVPRQWGVLILRPDRVQPRAVSPAVGVSSQDWECLSELHDLAAA